MLWVNWFDITSQVSYQMRQKLEKRVCYYNKMLVGDTLQEHCQGSMWRCWDSGEHQGNNRVQ